MRARNDAIPPVSSSDRGVRATCVDSSGSRDSAGTEADAIVQLRDGRWIAVEVKLGQNRVDDAATSLTKLVKKIDTSKVGEPAALVVITGGQYAYARPNSVQVVPAGCLGA